MLTWNSQSGMCNEFSEENKKETDSRLCNILFECHQRNFARNHLYCSKRLLTDSQSNTRARIIIHLSRLQQ